MQCFYGHDMIDLIQWGDFTILNLIYIVHILALFSGMYYISLFKIPCTIKNSCYTMRKLGFLMCNCLTYIMPLPFWKRIESKVNWRKRDKKKVVFKTQNLLLLSRGKKNTVHIHGGEKQLKKYWLWKDPSVGFTS